MMRKLLNPEENKLPSFAVSVPVLWPCCLHYIAWSDCRVWNTGMPSLRLQSSRWQNPYWKLRSVTSPR